jgi:hypothetical protein
MIKHHFDQFQTAQKDIFVRLLTTSDPGLHTQLKLNEPGPSISELYGGDFLRGNQDDLDVDTITKTGGRSRRSSLRSRKSSLTKSRKSSASNLKKQASTNKLSPFPSMPVPMTPMDVESGGGGNVGSNQPYSNHPYSQGHGVEVELVDDDFDDAEEERRIKDKKRDKISFWESASSIGPTPEFKTSETLVRVFSLLVAWE